MKSYLLPIVALFCVTIFFSSCKTREKLVYFQTSESDSASVQASNYTPTFKTDDFLSITVLGEDPESVAPFNLPTTSSNSNNSGYTMGNPALNGYLIDVNGAITFPIIGTIQLAGLNRMEATTLLQTKLKEYITNPIVHIQIQNFKVTVLGDVKNPGTFKIPNERITLLEAIGLAGDLKMTGVRKNILVIRDINGVKTEYRIDLTSKELFSSPVYYLSQNDVVYVEPNSASRAESSLWKTTGTIFISLTSLVVTTITLLSR